MAGRPTSPHHGPWVRGLAVLGMVAYLGGMGWFMTLCTAALAVVDGDHSVRIESHRRGFFVILGHDRCPPRPGQVHAHDWLARVLTSMSGDWITPGGDHVIDLDRDPGLAARPVEASMRDSIGRQGPAAVLTPVPIPAVALSSLPSRQVCADSVPVLCPSLRVVRTHVLRC